MTVELIDPGTERQAVEVVKEAISLYSNDETLTPSQSLIKAAQGREFTPDMLCRLTEAFNSSAQLAHLESADEEKRADAVPLADAAKVVEAFFPETVQSRAEKAAAVEAPDCYETTERTDFMPINGMEKAAQEPIKLSRRPRQYETDPGMVYNRIRQNKQAAYSRAEQLQTEAQLHIDKVAQSAGSLIDYFRRPGHTPFAEVEKRASVNFDGIDNLMNHVYGTGSLAMLGEKRAEEPGKGIAFIDDEEAPYSYIKEAVASSEVFAKALVKAGKILNEADVQYERDFRDYQLYKEAVVPGLLAALPGGVEKIAPTPEIREPRLEPVLADPEHEARLAAIEQRSTLSNLMADDPVISAVDPKEVIRAFNRLSSMAPHVARDPNLLRSVLRRYVQTEDVDPFELKQLVDLDIALRRREEPAAPERVVLG